MIENIALGAAMLFDPLMLLAIVAGVLAGTLIGVLPGLTSTLGVALLIPVTFAMPPTVGLAMLGGVYVASTYSGAISAILFNIPGTPSAVATLLDGYPMAQQGQPMRALAIATFGSAIGGVLSVLALLLLAPMLATFSLRFVPPEFFLLAVFGITVIASLSAGAMEKGLIAGGLGLLLSTIGSHPITGDMRFTAGLPSLYDGVPLVVALIGLYSIPEVIDLVARRLKPNAEAGRLDSNNPYSYLGEVLRQKVNLLRSSLIGIVVGIIPGVGSSVGGFIAYDAAKRAASDSDRFGKGSPAGLLACETSNNAVTGGTLIPLMTLGIRGNPVTAILLGGLLIHGLKPGADLFTSNADIAYGFILSLLVSNLLLVPVGLLVARHFVHVVRLPASILATAILVLALVGTYSMRSALDDVLIMLTIGALGFLLNVFAVPRAPLVLGLVLGSLAEGELARSLALVQGDWLAFAVQLLTRPLSLVLVLMCLFSLYQGLMQHRRQSRYLE